ncbi:MAG: hypothetical protein V1834_04105 [Candidatus Micrarchaeota archaeon]
MAKRRSGRGRGKERTVNCDKCGRQVRRDKAVYYEKTMFSNPMDRKDVVDEYYTRTLRREVAYCPSCGKHMGIYDKKKKQQERTREREFNRPFFNKPRPSFGSKPRTDAPAAESKPAVEKPVETQGA